MLKGVAWRVAAATAGLLICSNVFMTFAWYAHLEDLRGRAWYVAALVSWSIALFEYLLQVPANRIGYSAFCAAAAEDPAGSHHAGGLRAVRHALHAPAVEAGFRLGRTVPARRGLFHVPLLMAKPFINIEDLRRAARAPPAAVGVRLHRRRRRRGSHAARELPRVRRRRRSGRAARSRRRRCDLKTTVLGTPISTALPPRAGRQQPHVLSARRRSRRAVAGAAGTIYILSTLSGCRLEDVKKATRGPVVVPALSRAAGATSRAASVQRARDERLHRARRHDRHAGRRAARARRRATASKELLTRQSAADAAARRPVPRAGPRWLAGLLRATAG